MGGNWWGLNGCLTVPRRSLRADHCSSAPQIADALSRAKDEVHMTYSYWTQNQYGRRFVNGPSEFLAEVRDQLE
jgi:hypothetical protein